MTDAAVSDAAMTAADEALASRPSEIVRRPGLVELHPQRSARRRRVIDLGLGIGVPVVLLLLWQVASTNDWIDARLYPSPTDIVSEAFDLQDRGLLWPHLWATVRRVLYGYLIGSGLGVLFGLVMGMSRPVRSALEPLLNALYTVPKLALLPVFLTIFGLGETPAVALIAVTVFFFVWISTMAAVLAVPSGYREAARSLNVNRWQMFRHVLLPGSLPPIFVGLRIAAGVSVLMVVGVEFVVSTEGLGYLIEQGRTLLLLGQTYVGIVIAALFGLVFAGVVRMVGRLVAPWAEVDKGIDRI